MAYKFTYGDFQKELEKSGMGGEFSPADLKLAQQNPDAGMSILKYKRDYKNATTDEARALANQGAESVRSSYGGYTGGEAGSSFHLNPLSPIQYDAGQAPSYQSRYDTDIQQLYGQQKNQEKYQYSLPAPTYENRYDGQIQDLLGQVAKREPFSYDVETDPVYSAYRKQYTREGQRATQDALGAAAAASGGIPSSYAQTAAGQAANAYAAQMTDKIPELYQMAYSQYLNEQNMNLNALGAVQAAEQSDYDKYLNALGQYNTDRNFDYGVWQDEYNRRSDALQTALGLEQLDYNKYQDALEQFNTDRNFNYGQLMDELEHQEMLRQEQMNKAQLAATYGDYNFLNEMGIKTDNNDTDYQRRYNAAVLAAQYGDFSGLKALGINPNAANLFQFNATAAGKTGVTGGGSRGSSGGSRRGSGSGGGGTSGGQNGNVPVYKNGNWQQMSQQEADGQVQSGKMRKVTYSDGSVRYFVNYGKGPDPAGNSYAKKKN